MIQIILEYLIVSIICKLPILGHPFLDGRQQAPV